jgi:hypothetical protein
MKRKVRAAGSLYITSGLLTAISLWYIIVRITGAVEGTWGPFNLWSFRAFYTLLCLNVLAAFIKEAVTEKRRIEIFIYISAFFVLLSGAYVYVYHFNGTLSIGEGEDYKPVKGMYSSISMGPRAGIPGADFSMRVVEPGNREGYAEVLQKGEIMTLGPVGMETGGARFRFIRTGPLPFFHLALINENSVEQSYIKLNLAPPYREDSFTFRFLPHEFFIRNADGKKDALLVNIRRGKRSLYEGVLSIGKEKAEVDGIILSLWNIRKYAVLNVRKLPGLTVFLICLVIFVSLMGIKAVFYFRDKGRQGR